MSARSTQYRHLPCPLTSTKRSKVPPPSQICTHTQIGGPHTWSGVFVQLVWGGASSGGGGGGCPDLTDLCGHLSQLPTSNLFWFTHGRPVHNDRREIRKSVKDRVQGIHQTPQKFLERVVDTGVSLGQELPKGVHALLTFVEFNLKRFHGGEHKVAV